MASAPSGDPRTLYREARRLWNTDRPAAAKLLKAVLKQAPGHTGAHKLLGFYYQSSNPKLAVKHFKRYLNKVPGDSAIRDLVERLDQ